MNGDQDILERGSSTTGLGQRGWSTRTERQLATSPTWMRNACTPHPKDGEVHDPCAIHISAIRGAVRDFRSLL